MPVDLADSQKADEEDRKTDHAPLVAATENEEVATLTATIETNFRQGDLETGVDGMKGDLTEDFPRLVVEMRGEFLSGNVGADIYESVPVFSALWTQKISTVACTSFSKNIVAVVQQTCPCLSLLVLIVSVRVCSASVWEAALEEHSTIVQLTRAKKRQYVFVVRFVSCWCEAFFRVETGPHVSFFCYAFVDPPLWRQRLRHEDKNGDEKTKEVVSDAPRRSSCECLRHFFCSLWSLCSLCPFPVLFPFLFFSQFVRTSYNNQCNFDTSLVARLKLRFPCFSRSGETMFVILVTKHLGQPS